MCLKVPAIAGAFCLKLYWENPKKKYAKNEVIFRRATSNGENHLSSIDGLCHACVLLANGNSTLLKVPEKREVKEYCEWSENAVSQAVL